MKIVCAGMSKTGTTTMAAALSELGFSVYDFMENFEFLGEKWINVIQNGWKTDDFRVMYENVDAACDIPAYYFWEEILTAFPDAKVILTLRDNEDEWFRSIHNQMGRFDGIHIWAYALLSTTWRKLGRFAFIVGMVPFGTSFMQMLNVPELPYKQIYRRHNAHIMHTCAKEKLLIFKVKEGWSPLCDFLGVPVPDKPFPVENVRGQIAVDRWNTSVFRRIKREAGISSCILLLLAGFTAAKYWKLDLTRAFFMLGE